MILRKLSLCLVLFAPASGALTFEGKALDIKSKRHIYTEKHKVENDEGGFNRRIATEYVRPDGTVFAKIQSDFSKDRFIPDVNFEDLRFGLKEKITFDPQAKVVTVSSEKTGTSQVKSATLKLQKNMLAGQGFNNFLLDRFSELQNGVAIPVHFIVLAKRDHYHFDVRLVRSFEEKMVFGLQVHNVILKLFVKEIEVEYDRSTKRLLRFKGLSNLPDDKDQSQVVDITYSYSD